MKMDRGGPHSAPPPAGDESADMFELNTHPFIVKVWLEETAAEAGRATWRGHITHVPSGRRRYLQDLADIPAFILPYLEAMGVKIRRRWRLAAWLRRWSAKPMKQESEPAREGR
jgi:hypothetical protein